MAVDCRANSRGVLSTLLQKINTIKDGTNSSFNLKYSVEVVELVQSKLKNKYLKRQQKSSKTNIDNSLVLHEIDQALKVWASLFNSYYNVSNGFAANLTVSVEKTSSGDIDFVLDNNSLKDSITSNERTIDIPTGYKWKLLSNNESTKILFTSLLREIGTVLGFQSLNYNYKSLMSSYSIGKDIQVLYNVGVKHGVVLGNPLKFDYYLNAQLKCIYGRPEFKIVYGDYSQEVLFNTDVTTELFSPLDSYDAIEEDVEYSNVTAYFQNTYSQFIAFSPLNSFSKLIYQGIIRHPDPRFISPTEYLMPVVENNAIEEVYTNSLVLGKDEADFFLYKTDTEKLVMTDRLGHKLNAPTTISVPTFTGINNSSSVETFNYTSDFVNKDLVAARLNENQYLVVSTIYSSDSQTKIAFIILNTGLDNYLDDQSVIEPCDSDLEGPSGNIEKYKDYSLNTTFSPSYISPEYTQLEYKANYTTSNIAFITFNHHDNSTLGHTIMLINGRLELVIINVAEDFDIENDLGNNDFSSYNLPYSIVSTFYPHITGESTSNNSYNFYEFPFTGDGSFKRIQEIQSNIWSTSSKLLDSSDSTDADGMYTKFIISSDVSRYALVAMGTKYGIVLMDFDRVNCAFVPNDPDNIQVQNSSEQRIGTLIHLPAGPHNGRPAFGYNSTWHVIDIAFSTNHRYLYVIAYDVSDNTNKLYRYDIKNGTQVNDQDTILNSITEITNSTDNEISYFIKGKNLYVASTNSSLVSSIINSTEDLSWSDVEVTVDLKPGYTEDSLSVVKAALANDSTFTLPNLYSVEISEPLSGRLSHFITPDKVFEKIDSNLSEYDIKTFTPLSPNYTLNPVGSPGISAYSVNKNFTLTKFGQKEKMLQSGLLLNDAGYPIMMIEEQRICSTVETNQSDLYDNCLNGNFFGDETLIDENAQDLGGRDLVLFDRLGGEIFRVSMASKISIPFNTQHTPFNYDSTQTLNGSAAQTDTDSYAVADNIDTTAFVSGLRTTSQNIALAYDNSSKKGLVMYIHTFDGRDTNTLLSRNRGQYTTTLKAVEIDFNEGINVSSGQCIFNNNDSSIKSGSIVNQDKFEVGQTFSAGTMKYKVSSFSGVYTSPHPVLPATNTSAINAEGKHIYEFFYNTFSFPKTSGNPSYIGAISLGLGMVPFSSVTNPNNDPHPTSDATGDLLLRVFKYDSLGQITKNTIILSDPDHPLFTKTPRNIHYSVVFNNRIPQNTWTVISEQSNYMFTVWKGRIFIHSINDKVSFSDFSLLYTYKGRNKIYDGTPLLSATSNTFTSLTQNELQTDFGLVDPLGKETLGHNLDSVFGITSGALQQEVSCETCSPISGYDALEEGMIENGVFSKIEYTDESRDGKQYMILVVTHFLDLPVEGVADTLSAVTAIPEKQYLFKFNFTQFLADLNAGCLKGTGIYCYCELIYKQNTSGQSITDSSFGHAANDETGTSIFISSESTIDYTSYYSGDPSGDPSNQYNNDYNNIFVSGLFRDANGDIRISSTHSYFPTLGKIIVQDETTYYNLNPVNIPFVWNQYLAVNPAGPNQWDGNNAPEYNYYQQFFNPIIYTVNSIEAEEIKIFGCTDNAACNYDSSATDDDGSCYYDQSGCGCGSTQTPDDCGVCRDEGDILYNTTCAVCTDENAINYDPNPTAPYVVNNAAVCDYGNVCTDPDACNVADTSTFANNVYNSDDTTCIYSLPGCDCDEQLLPTYCDCNGTPKPTYCDCSGNPNTIPGTSNLPLHLQKYCDCALGTLPTNPCGCSLDTVIAEYSVPTTGVSYSDFNNSDNQYYCDCNGTLPTQYYKTENLQVVYSNTNSRYFCGTDAVQTDANGDNYVLETNTDYESVLCLESARDCMGLCPDQTGHCPDCQDIIVYLDVDHDGNAGVNQPPETICDHPNNKHILSDLDPTINNGHCNTPGTCFVTTNTDEDPTCDEALGRDCAGVCDGPATLDACYICRAEGEEGYVSAPQKSIPFVVGEECECPEVNLNDGTTTKYTVDCAGNCKLETDLTRSRITENCGCTPYTIEDDNYCYGCTDPTACNYDNTKTYDDDTCEFSSCAGCMDPYACNYDSTARIHDESLCNYSCYGCQDSSTPACNYDESNTIITRSCTDYVINSRTPTGDAAQTILNAIGGVFVYNNSGEITGIQCCNYTSCLGCTDPVACNYNSDATQDDGTCVYSYCQFYAPDCGECAECTDQGGNCEGECFQPDPCCGHECPEGFSAVVVNGECDCQENFVEILGCTNPDAVNYNPQANTDDGSCIAKVYGCTDSNAINYNPNANTDDGSCEYEEVITYPTCADEDLSGVCVEAIYDNAESEYSFPNGVYNTEAANSVLVGVRSLDIFSGFKDSSFFNTLTPEQQNNYNTAVPVPSSAVVDSTENYGLYNKFDNYEGTVQKLNRDNRVLRFYPDFFASNLHDGELDQSKTNNVIFFTIEASAGYKGERQGGIPVSQFLGNFISNLPGDITTIKVKDLKTGEVAYRTNASNSQPGSLTTSSGFDNDFNIESGFDILDTSNPNFGVEQEGGCDGPDLAGRDEFRAGSHIIEFEGVSVLSSNSLRDNPLSPVRVYSIELTKATSSSEPTSPIITTEIDVSTSFCDADVDCDGVCDDEENASIGKCTNPNAYNYNQADLEECPNWNSETLQLNPGTLDEHCFSDESLCEFCPPVLEQVCCSEDYPDAINGVVPGECQECSETDSPCQFPPCFGVVPAPVCCEPPENVINPQVKNECEFCHYLHDENTVCIPHPPPPPPPPPSGDLVIETIYRDNIYNFNNVSPDSTNLDWVIYDSNNVIKHSRRYNLSDPHSELVDGSKIFYTYINKPGCYYFLPIGHEQAAKYEHITVNIRNASEIIHSIEYRNAPNITGGTLISVNQNCSVGCGVSNPTIVDSPNCSVAINYDEDPSTKLMFRLTQNSTNPVSMENNSSFIGVVDMQSGKYVYRTDTFSSNVLTDHIIVKGKDRYALITNLVQQGDNVAQSGGFKFEIIDENSLVIFSKVIEPGSYNSHTIHPFTIKNKIYGCTDSSSSNYNPKANVDDGSCIEQSFLKCVQDKLFKLDLSNCESKEADRALEIYAMYKALIASKEEMNQTKYNKYKEKLSQLCDAEYCETC